ncbi:MAG: type II-A CRISPR-associated protein Csn2 [Tissierellia bacterium]|nr:type II-A CRISPR-associated protein Csn2 [Tissierellia bacterium]
MILQHEAWNFEIDLEGINTIVVENPKLFRTILNDLNAQTSGWEGGFSLYEDLKEKSIKKEIILIQSPYIASINERKIIGKLHEEIKNDILSGEFEKFRQLESEILKFADEMTFNNSIELEIGNSIEIVDLLKIAGVKFREEIGNVDIIDKMAQYAIIMQQFINPTAQSYTNIKGMFMEDEWEDFIKELRINRVNLLLFENHHTYGEKEGEKIYTIDMDYCEIY